MSSRPGRDGKWLRKNKVFRFLKGKGDQERGKGKERGVPLSSRRRKLPSEVLSPAENEFWSIWSVTKNTSDSHKSVIFDNAAYI